MRVRQTGEGDHSVVVLGDFLYLFFLEWDAPDGALTVGAARAPLTSRGAPGAWLKLLNSTWSSPGVGGDATAIGGLPGSAVFAAPGLGPGALLSVGCAFTGGPMGISWSVDGEGRAWAAAAAGPLYTAPPGSWNRGPSSAELFAYPSMTGPRGAGAGIPLDGTALVYATYLAAGTDFSARWLLRRPVAFMQSVDAAAPPPAALAALSLWATAGAGCTAAARAWATTGPVVPASGFAIVAAIIALLPTSPVCSSRR